MTLGTGTCHEAGIKQIKVKNMKIFHSYGYNSNAPLIEKIKEYLSKYAEGNLSMRLGYICRKSRLARTGG